MKSGDHGNYIHSHKSVTSVHSCKNTEYTTSGNALAQASRGHTIMLLPVLKPSCHKKISTYTCEQIVWYLKNMSGELHSKQKLQMLMIIVSERTSTSLT